MFERACCLGLVCRGRPNLHKETLGSVGVPGCRSKHGSIRQREKRTTPIMLNKRIIDANKNACRLANIQTVVVSPALAVNVTVLSDQGVVTETKSTELRGQR